MFSLTILACSVCYGDPASSVTQGLNMGILFMLGVTALVLGGFGIGFIVLMRRARRYEQLEETQT
jgi:hypothetical protein